MKTLTILFTLLLSVCIVSAQEISGKWYGLLKLPGTDLTVVVNISKTEAGAYTATMDSPDQGAFGIPVNSIKYENKQLELKIDALQAAYKAELVDMVLKGTFTQMGQDFNLNLSQEEIKKTKALRPQEPQKPYPYYDEEVTFTNSKAGIKLAGTLTLPKKGEKFPAVVLISGSGPQNRDEEVFGHKPFLVLADHLTHNGIAVLRFDDRGVNQSEGDHSTATSADFATDVESAVAYLKTRSEIDLKKIGLMGHSEGGLIAPMVAANDKSIAFIVLLAGPGMRGKELLPLQTALITKAQGAPDEAVASATKINSALFAMINTTDTREALNNKIINYIKSEIDPNELPEEFKNNELLKAQIDQLTSPWMRYFLNYDPLPALAKVTCPVLALNGEKDLQVPPKENLSNIEKTLKGAGNNKVTAIEFKGLNHLFQECETGSPTEYGNIEQTISEKALTTISNWIVQNTANN
jgi:hypothetical protein